MYIKNAYIVYNTNIYNYAQVCVYIYIYTYTHTERERRQKDIYIIYIHTHLEKEKEGRNIYTYYTHIHTQTKYTYTHTLPYLVYTRFYLYKGSRDVNKSICSSVMLNSVSLVLPDISNISGNHFTSK